MTVCVGIGHDGGDELPDFLDFVLAPVRDHPARDGLGGEQRSDVDAAREIAVLQPELSARDCLHLAVMQANGVDRILTFDNGFSEQMGVTRLP